VATMNIYIFPGLMLLRESGALGKASPGEEPLVTSVSTPGSERQEPGFGHAVRGRVLGTVLVAVGVTVGVSSTAYIAATRF
jgi:hypothetical protein